MHHAGPMFSGAPDHAVCAIGAYPFYSISHLPCRQITC
jgi:hypothetical protein